MTGLKLLCFIFLLTTTPFQVRARYSTDKFKNQLLSVLDDAFRRQENGEMDSVFASRGEEISNDDTSKSLILNDENDEKRGIGGAIANLLKTILPKIPRYIYKTGLVLVNLGDTGLKIGSIVKTLGDSYTNGCFSVPMICTYMDRIKEIEPRCNAKAAILEKLYGKYREDYRLLQDVAENNVYINAKIEDFVDMLGVLDKAGQNVQKIQDASLNLQKLRGKSDTELLQLLRIPIEYSVVKLKELKEESSIFTADLFSILTFEIGSYVAKSAFAKYKKHMEDLQCAGCNLFHHQRNKEAYKKLVFTAVKLTYKDFKDFFKDGFFIKNVKDLSKNAWNKFKQKITNPKSTVQKYIKGLTAAAAIASLAANAINIHLLIEQHKGWKDVEAKMAEAWTKHVEREKELDASIKDAKEKSEPLPSYTQNAIDDYIQFINTFDKKVNELLEGSGLPKQIFTTNEKVTAKNIRVKQAATLRNIDKIINSLVKMKNWMTAFSTFNNHVKNKIDANIPLNAAFKEIKNNWRYFGNDIQDYFFLVRLENYVCTVSTLRLADDFYSNYDLKSIRGTCAMSPKYSFSEEYKRSHKDRTIDFYVKQHLSSARSLSQLHNKVGQELRNDPILNSDSGLTDQLLMCKVAELSPLAKWNRYKLQFFRVQNCKTMSQGNFFDLLEKAYP